MVQALSKLYVFARIGDEYIDHISRPLSPKLRNLLRHSTMITVLGKAVGHWQELGLRNQAGT